MTTEPANFFRDMMGQWEMMTNQLGGAAARTPDAARAVDAAAAATAQVQDATRDAMGKALAVYNLPSRDEVTGLSDRLGGLEDRLARIESLLTELAGKTDATPAPRRRTSAKSSPDG